MVCEKRLKRFGDFLFHRAARSGKALLGDRALSHSLPEHVSFPPVALPTDTRADTA